MLTFLSSPTTGSAWALAIAGRKIREVSSWGGGSMGCGDKDGGGADAFRVEPGYPGYGDVDELCWSCGAGGP